MGCKAQLWLWDRPGTLTLWHMRRPLIAVFAAVVLAGCGDGGDDPAARATATATPTPTATVTATPTTDPAATSGPERDAVADVLDRYAAAVRAGDGRTICRELLAREVTERVERAGGSCERDLMAPRIQEGGPDYAIGIASIVVQGDRAVARITAGERDGARDTSQPLVRERGGWRLAAG
jgi:hypothetical protein